MMLHLKRVAVLPGVTFGVLLENGEPFAVTLEDPWKNNAVGESCIPKGSYKCRRVNSPKFGNTFEITNVPGRTHILFHRGNTTADTRGCVLIGESFEPLNGTPGIAHSGEGFAEFLRLLQSVNEFQLTISSE